MRHGQVKSNSLALNCIYCGETRARLRVNLTNGVFHCFRCDASGKVPGRVLFELYGVGQDIPDKQGALEILPGPGSTRVSLLSRWHTIQGDDAFCLWSPEGLHQGIYVRGSQSKMIRGLGGASWPGAPNLLTSTPDDPIRLVEGPYDVLHPKDMAMFGLFPSGILKYLKGHYFIWAPDGDVWVKPELISILRSKLQRLIKVPGFLGVEFLGRMQDPDETSGQFIPRKELAHLWPKKQSISLKAPPELVSPLSSSTGRTW